MITSAWARLVRLGFHLLYNEFAFTYDCVSKAVSMGAWRCWQRQALPFLSSDDVVLELAHGTGDLQIDLRGAGYRTVGYDLSPHMGRIARAKLRRRALPAPLTRGRAQALPYPADTFGGVVSTFPSDFIVDARTLREVYRVLQPGGVFVIVPNAVLTSGGAARAGLEWLYRITGQREGVSETTHSPQAAVESLFAPHGFRARVEQRPCPRSLVTVIVAEKPKNL